MRKRILSLLMALCLLLGLIPAVTAPAAAADNYACIRYVHNMDEDPTESDYISTKPTFAVGGSWCVVFYTNDNGSAGTALEEPSFSVTAGSPELEITELDTEDYISDKGHTIYEIIPQEFGKGTLEITSGGVTYAMSYDVGLPDHGFYDSPTRSEDSFLLDYAFRYDDSHRTFYYIYNSFDKEQITIADICDADWGGDPDDVTVSLVNDTTVKLTVPAGTSPEGEYCLRVNIDDGSENWRERIWFNLENNTPAVRYREVYFEDGVGYEEGPLRTVLDIPAIFSRQVVFYYGTAENATPLQNYNVAVDDQDLAEIRLRDDRPLADGRKPLQLNGTGIGSTTLTFKMDSGETYTMPLNVNLPEFARYKRQEFSEDALIWDDVYDSTEDTVFWLMTEEGFENPRVEELEFQKGDAEIDFVARTDDPDVSDVRVTIPAGTKGGVEFYLRVWGRNVGNWGTGVQLEDNAPGLRYAYIGFDDNDEPYLRREGRIYADYDEAMRSRPAMIFYYGTAEDPIPLTANSLDEAPAITFTNQNGQVRDDITAEPEALFSDGNHTNAVVYVMRNKRLGNGTLSATVNGETYSMSAKVGLPQFYFYTEREISKDSMLEDTVYAFGQETVFWLMTEDGHKNGTITELDIRSGDVKAELVPRTDDPTVSDVKITIPATCRGELNFYIHVRADNGGWGNSFRLEDTAPGLYFNYILYGPNGESEETSDFESTRRQPLTGDSHVVLYYGSKVEGTLTPITAADEDSIPEITVTAVDGGDPTVDIDPVNILDNGKVVYCIKGITEGASLLTHTVNGVEYGMTAIAELPTVGFYTTKDCTVESLIRNGKFDYTSGSRTFYYQSLSDGPDIVDFALSDDNETDYSNILTLRKLGDKRWAIDVADSFTGQSDWIRFDVELDWGDETDYFCTDLRLVPSTPAVYTRDFWVGPDGPEQSDDPLDSLDLWPGDNLDLIFYYGTHNDLSPLMNYTLEPADDSLLDVEQVDTYKDKPVYRVTALKANDPDDPTETCLILTLSDGTTYTYPITIYPLEAGALYHRMLEWDGNAEGYCLQEPGWLEADPISIAPYMDMYAFALYYSPDGMTYMPVEGQVRAGTSFDAVAIETDSDGEAVTGWYEMSPFDFGEGYLDAVVNGKTYSLKLETRMPYLAFYNETSMSEDSFRMYQLMGQNPNAATDGYRFTTTLYVQCDDPDFGFAPYHKFQAFQKQYDANGSQIGETPVAGDDFKAEIRTIKGGVMEVDLYSNVGDLLVWMFGFDDIEALNAEDPWDACDYGTYVNLLTPDEDSSLFVNLDDSGFAASKVLPKHLFEQAADADAGVKLGAESYPGTVNFDSDSVKNIMAELDKDQPVCIIMDHAPGTAPQDKAIERFAQKNKEIVTVVNLELLSGDSFLGTSAQGGLGGTVTVTYPCELDVADGTQVEIFYLDDSNKVQEKLFGTYSNGVLTFQTTHFSSFAVTLDVGIDVPEAMLAQKNAQIFAAFYKNGAMVDLRPVTAGGTLVNTYGLEEGLTYRLFCLDATHHTPLMQATEPDTF